MTPTYPFPWVVLPGLLVSSITNVKRPFKVDAQRLVGSLPKSLNVAGLENLPDCGPVLITTNHYSRPGFSMLWTAAAVSALVPQDICWTMTRAWTYPDGLPNLILGGMSRFILGQIARDYQFIPIPAIPAQPGETIEQAMAIRKLFRLIKSEPQAFIGLAPEGQDIPGGKLGWPPPGAGRFILEIARKGFQILPVGIFEDEDCLCLNFGQAYPILLPGDLPAKEVDQVVSRLVMQHIAGQLPKIMRGEFN
jgi:Acyltransferase